MRIAILLGNENQPDESVVQAYAFTVEDGVITRMCDELLNVRNIQYVASWLLGKNINEVFMNYDNTEVNDYLESIGVSVKKLECIKKNPLLKSFLI